MRAWPHRTGSAPIVDYLSAVGAGVQRYCVRWLAAGIVLVLGVHAGLYVLVGPVLVAFVGGIASAWLFLTKITE